MRNLWTNCLDRNGSTAKWGDAGRLFRRIQGALLVLLASLAVCLAAGLPVHAEILYTNSDTGYQVHIEDDAELLSQEEIESLAQRMQGITAYGNAMFKTIDENYTSTDNFARAYYRECFGNTSGTMFLIDMDNRNIWIRNDGRISKIITNAYSDTITDNCYRYASREDYYGCAREAFSQIEALLNGQRIAQPMKYICNAFLALIFSLLITLGLARLMSRSKAPGSNDLLRAAPHEFWLNNPQAIYTHTTKRYDPPSSDSGGGGSRGGGGGSSSSGSGGGHSF